MRAAAFYLAWLAMFAFSFACWYGIYYAAGAALVMVRRG